MKLLIATVALAVPLSAEAATIRTAVSADVNGIVTFDESNPTREVFDIQEDTTVSTAGGPASYSDGGSVSTALESASSSASANAATGVLRSRSEANASGDFNPLGRQYEAGASALVNLRETAVAVGSGLVTVTMAYDGFWNLAPQKPENGEFVSWIATGCVGFIGNISPIVGNECFQFDGNNGGFSGSTADVFTISGTVTDGAEFGFQSLLSTFVGGGTNGVVDFGNSAFLSVETSDGLSLGFSDERFLSIDPDGGDVGVIPVPAGFPMLLSALGLLSILRRRRL